jgi:Predicted CoA-binding protein
MTKNGTESVAWRDHLVNTADGISRVLEGTRTVAVLGIKTEETGAPAFYVPEYAQAVGLRIIPVPVYYPDVTEILGERVYRTVAGIGEPIDMVNVFRRPADIPPHIDDIIAAKPRSVWFQLGIVNDAAAEAFAKAGIDVVQDRCLLVELQRRAR